MTDLFSKDQTLQSRKVRRSKNVLSVFFSLMTDGFPKSQYGSQTHFSLYTSGKTAFKDTLRDATDPTPKAEQEHFLRVMAKSEDEQGRHRSKCLR